MNNSPGVEIKNPNFLKYLIKTITFNWDFKGELRFPAPQPISIEKKHFEKLKKFEYFVGNKDDGVRYIMMFIRDKHQAHQCILCDRNLKFYKVKINGDDTIFHNTLFDGELIHNGNGNYNFIVFDSVTICGNSIKKNTFDKRLVDIDFCIKTLINPYNENGNFKITSKTFYKVKDFNTFIESSYNTNDNSDGIIFVPVKLPVLNGTQFSMFKWKPKNKHTVDFLIKPNNSNLEAHVYNKGVISKFANILSSTPQGLKFIEDFNKLNVENKTECIIECLYSPENKNFTPVMIREDKSHPNSLSTVERTIFNSQENITIEDFKNLFN